MISISVVLGLLLAHFIGDFLFQTDRQAKGKSSNNLQLAIHVLTYTLTIALVPLSWLAFSHVSANIALIITWIVLNGVAHYVVDYTTSRINTILYSSGNIHEFFVCIGADQLVHMITLILTTFLLFGGL